MYDEEDYLALSGIQHFAFCRRQWGLIHIEQVWKDNVLTAEGVIMHERAHDECLRERRGDTLVVRGLHVSSAELGLSGVCDVVEFVRCNNGCSLMGEEGLWRCVPIEYKHGKSKIDNADKLQLCAQAMALETMLCCDISTGFLYYGKTRTRESVELSDELRDDVRRMAEEMHTLYSRRYVPKARQFPACKSCSLHQECLSRTSKLQKASTFVNTMLGEVVGS